MAIAKVFQLFGKASDTTLNSWKEAWTLVTAALDGTWGSYTKDTVTLNYRGQFAFWQTKVFTATTVSLSLDIPIVSNESYTAVVHNHTTGTSLSLLVSSNKFNVALIIGNSYQVISNHFPL